MNKKGWIKIVEAFTAILLIVGVVLVVISDEPAINLDLHSEIYESQLIALRDIQINSAMRQAVLDASGTDCPQEVMTRMNYFLLDYLTCEAKICGMESSCELDNPPEKTVHAQSVAITSTATTYDPKQLKLFCWEE